MSDARGPSAPKALPGWWQREKQRQQARILIFLTLLLTLIAFYYWVERAGIVSTPGINFDTADHLAFVRQDARGDTTLFAVRSDGTDLQPLTPKDDISHKEEPEWTMDGKRLVYSSNLKDPKLTQIYLLGAGQPTQLTYGGTVFAGGTKSAPTVSPDGDHIAFVAQGAVKSVRLNGTDVYQLMPPPRAGSESGGEVSPTLQGLEFTGPFLYSRFSSDGKGTAGVQDISNDPLAVAPGGAFGDEVVSVLPENSLRAWPLDSGHEVSLAWEPGGGRLACSFTEHEVQKSVVSGIRIWPFDANGKPQAPTPVFAGVGYSIEPKNISWSPPKGARIAFEAWRLKSKGVREPRGIAVVSIDGKGMMVDAAHAEGMRYLVPASPSGTPQKPRWSPDGNKLSFEMVRPDGKRDIWVINSDGTNSINLTHGEGDNMDAVWSPISSH